LRLRFFWVCLLTLWLLPCAAQTTRFDLSFRHWGETYASFVDWHWFKAQGMAESGLNQAARSQCGAIGVMQLMAPTAAGLRVNPYDPETNIQGGIHYDAQMLAFWQRAANAGERLDLAFASYNAGPGNIQRAVRLANGLPEWSTARLCLPQVTGQHSAETLGYVVHIHQNYSRLAH